MKRAGWRVLLVAVVAVFGGCGNPRPPEPPSLELPRPARDLHATRKGQKVFLTWTVPQRTTEGETVRYLGPTRICRGVEPVLKTCGGPVGEAASPKPIQAKKGTLAPIDGYVDTLPPNLASSPMAAVTYAIEVLNDAQRSAGLSNQVHVSAAPTLPPPGDFRAQAVPEGVQLSWWAISPAPPAAAEIQYEYRIYRREQGASHDVVIADLPLSTSQFVDQTLQWEKTYTYHMAVVTLIQHPPCSGNSSSLQCGTTTSVEGADSEPVQVFAHDVFPPEVPAGLLAVFSGTSGEEFIDLIWNPDTASDLAGYNVYRREDDGQWTQINAELVKAPAYRDTKVELGKQYFYSVSAVDVRGNQSGRSAEANETVPK